VWKKKGPKGKSGALKIKVKTKEKRKDFAAGNLRRKARRSALPPEKRERKEGGQK